MCETVRGGIITLTSQTRFVDVTTNGAPGVSLLPMDQRIDAPDFGAFDHSVNLAFNTIGINQGASQQSTLTLTADGTAAMIDATGLLSTGASANGLNATSHFEVDFVLTQSEPYLLTYNGRQGDPRPTSPQTFVPGHFSGPSAPGLLVGDPITTNFLTTLTYTGTLQPGDYELLAEAQTIGGASFDVHLAIGTAAVPLPRACWMALSVVPLMWLGKRSWVRSFRESVAASF